MEHRARSKSFVFLGILWQTFANQFSTDHLLLVLFNAQATNTG